MIKVYPDEVRFVVVIVCLSACGPSNTEAEVVKQYALNLDANYKDVIAKLLDLQNAVDAFVNAPSQDGFDAAKSAWLAARPSYGECEVSRFYGGPLDTMQGGMNEWPIDETFIDYTFADDTGGIVNDPTNYPLLTPTVLATSDEKGGIENLSTGFHAIEFLLWGQRTDQTAGPGERPYTDYLDGGTHANQDRRRTYLKSATDLLVSDMQSLEAQWNLSDPTTYGAKMVAGNAHDALTLMLRGFSSMAISELYFERLSNPFVTQARKDEESCFSENTWVDLQANALGVEDVYLGRYHDLHGPSVSDLVRAKNAHLDQQLKDQLTSIRNALAAIPQPFDHSVIAPGGSDASKAVQAAIDACVPLRPIIEMVVAALNVKINV